MGYKVIVFTWILAFFVIVFVSCLFDAGLRWTSFLLAILLLMMNIFYQFSAALLTVSLIFVVLVILLNIKPLRIKLLTSLIFNMAKKAIPTLSKTEKEALSAGSVSFERELFIGKPSFKDLLKQKPYVLSKEEEDFLSGPTTELCRMLDDWQIYKDKDLPSSVWQFIKEQGFLGMIIPKKYGGKEFSASLHSAVIMKVGSKNFVAAITIGVPNSLGPAELLLKYGTDEQKNYYLPRLALGDEIPCFALTGPLAGSDAASIPDYGIVSFKEINGEKTLGIRLNFDKRYITLAPVATLIGLAFKLKDPDHLLSDEEERGITCALISRDTPGIDIGKRHFPFDIMFQNGPIKGRDVFIPLSNIIGGQEQIGKGWRMLMECLSVGRAITLPSSSTASSMITILATGSYARIRHQFGLAIGRFEGVQQLLARMAANTYINSSALRFVLNRIDAKEDPSVLSAIVKYHTTERCRQVVDDGMDIHAGKAICLGPKNYMANLYRGVPINITVEGANILTRNMIIFGQGSIRCHPYLLKEMKSLADNDLVSFDDALFSHIGYMLHNGARAFAHAISNGMFLSAPPSLLEKHYKRIARLSIAYAFVADIMCTTFGSKLKRKESLSARLGDILSYLFLASSVLKSFHDEGEKKEALPLVDYACEWLFYDIEKSFNEVFNNLPQRFLACFMRSVCFFWGMRPRLPSDKKSEQVAELLISESETLDKMTDVIYKENNFLSTLQEAKQKIIDAHELEKRIYKAKKSGIIYGLNEEDVVNEARKKNLINDHEYETLLDIAKIRADIIAVDAF